MKPVPIQPWSTLQAGAATASRDQVLDGAMNHGDGGQDWTFSRPAGHPPLEHRGCHH